MGRMQCWKTICTHHLKVMLSDKLVSHLQPYQERFEKMSRLSFPCHCRFGPRFTTMLINVTGVWEHNDWSISSSWWFMLSHIRALSHCSVVRASKGNGGCWEWVSSLHIQGQSQLTTKQILLLWLFSSDLWIAINLGTPNLKRQHFWRAVKARLYNRNYFCNFYCMACTREDAITNCWAQCFYEKRCDPANPVLCAQSNKPLNPLNKGLHMWQKL